MEITLPSLADPALAPDGACVLSANVQYAPYALKEGWATGKPRFLTAIMAVLERYAPGIGKSVRHAELLTPADIEARYLMPGGDWHHGELQADQMLMSRPVFGAAGYDTPVERPVPVRRRLAPRRRNFGGAGAQRRPPDHRDEG